MPFRRGFDPNRNYAGRGKSAAGKDRQRAMNVLCNYSVDLLYVTIQQALDGCRESQQFLLSRLFPQAREPGMSLQWSAGAGRQEGSPLPIPRISVNVIPVPSTPPDSEDAHRPHSIPGYGAAPPGGSTLVARGLSRASGGSSGLTEIEGRAGAKDQR